MVVEVMISEDIKAMLVVKNSITDSGDDVNDYDGNMNRLHSR